MSNNRNLGWIQTFAAEAAVAGSNLAVVYSTAHSRTVKMPGGALAVGFAGITTEASSSDASNTLAVQIGGVAQVTSDGSAVINPGDELAIANTSGQVKTFVVAAPSSGEGTVREVLGVALCAAPATAGALVDMRIQPHIYVGA